jgi:hypothetical protein
VQFYLHECGDVTLGQFSIESSSRGPIFVNKAEKELPLAEVPPMPSNIKGFKKITIKFVCFLQQKVTILSFISYYDQSVLGFLQEFHRNSLFTNVNLALCGHHGKFDAMSQMMTQLLPSITSIESLKPIYLNHDYNAALFQEHSNMLASAKILIIWSGFIHIL